MSSPGRQSVRTAAPPDPGSLRRRTAPLRGLRSANPRMPCSSCEPSFRNVALPMAGEWGRPTINMARLRRWSCVAYPGRGYARFVSLSYRGTRKLKDSPLASQGACLPHTAAGDIFLKQTNAELIAYQQTRPQWNFLLRDLSSHQVTPTSAPSWNERHSLSDFPLSRSRRHSLVGQIQ